MAETLTRQSTGGDHDEPSLDELGDQPAESKRKRGPGTYILATAAAGVAVAVALFGERLLPGDTDEGGGNTPPRRDRVVIDTAPSTETSTAATPTPSSGGFGKVVLRCTGIRTHEMVPGAYTYMPQVEGVVGDLNSPYLFTVGSYFDKDGNDRNTAVQGVGLIGGMSFSLGHTPVAVNIIDLSGVLEKPMAAADFPHPGSIDAINLLANAAIYPCDAVGLDDRRSPIYQGG